jgi:hypothetical protein
MKSPLPFALLSVGGTSDEPLSSAIKAVWAAKVGEATEVKAIITIANTQSLFIG